MKININGMELNLGNMSGQNISLTNGQIIIDGKEFNKEDNKSKGKYIGKTYSFNEIAEIDSNTTFDIEVDNSKENKKKPKDLVSVEAYENDHNKIQISENNGILSIRSSNGNFGKVKIKVSSSMLNKIKLTGTGNLTGNYEGQELNIVSSGTSDILLSGSSKILLIKNSGAGDMNLNSFESENIEMTNSGTGNLELWSKTAISGKNSGTGDIKYFGVKEHNIKNSGLGDIKYKGEKTNTIKNKDLESQPKNKDENSNDFNFFGDYPNKKENKTTTEEKTIEKVDKNISNKKTKYKL